MEVQDFTSQEQLVFSQAAAVLIQNPTFAAARQNMTKAQMKASDSSAIQAQIDSINASISGIDSKYDTMKTNELQSLNDSLTFYQGLQTKILNTPE